MKNIYEKFSSINTKSSIILQVHDELLIECPIDEVDNISNIVKNEMQSAVELYVPIIVDLKTGFSWADAH